MQLLGIISRPRGLVYSPTYEAWCTVEYTHPYWGRWVSLYARNDWGWWSAYGFAGKRRDDESKAGK